VQINILPLHLSKIACWCNRLCIRHAYMMQEWIDVQICIWFQDSISGLTTLSILKSVVSMPAMIADSLQCACLGIWYSWPFSISVPVLMAGVADWVRGMYTLWVEVADGINLMIMLTVCSMRPSSRRSKFGSRFRMSWSHGWSMTGILLHDRNRSLSS